MAKRQKESPLFRQAVQDVKPLHCDVIPIQSPRPPPHPRQKKMELEAIRQDMLSEHFDPAELETGEELVYLRPGLQQAVLKKLRQGRFSIHAELDLHGMIVPEARAEVSDFLKYCQLTQIRCVRIIHGKGNGSWGKQPILKTKLNHWLRQRDEVLAFCSARPVDGGTGAVYVLLKR